MGLESGTFLNDLVASNPIGASDNIDKGDDHIRLIKTLLKNSFPDVDQAVSTIIFNAVSPPLTRKGTLWGDETADLLKIRNKGDTAFITLSISMLVSNSVDIDAGTIDGAAINSTPIGATTPSTGKFTTLESTGVATLNSLVVTGNINQLESGLVACFFQAAAPTTWTQVTTQNDKLLRVVSGAGGGTAGSWTITGVSVDSHVLAISEIPSHDHTVETQGPEYAGAATGVRGFTPATSGRNTGLTGGGSGHVHGLTSDAAWRPAYIDMILASKD